jgi:hypothetical protein
VGRAGSPRADATAQEAGRAAVRAWLAEQSDVPTEALTPSSWLVTLAGERKQAIPVHLSVGERETVVQSFFMRAPDENEAALYAYLLRRHARSYVLRFALTDDGDVLLVAVLPNRAVTTAEIDRVLGQLLVTADEAFDQALRLGFASYIEREQAWRARVGAPRNPVS